MKHLPLISAILMLAASAPYGAGAERASVGIPNITVWNIQAAVLEAYVRGRESVLIEVVDGELGEVR